MYFNLDRQGKQKILKYYKKEANEYRRKKEEAKKQQIQEELNYLHQREQNQLKSDEKLSQENFRKKKALMDEYLEMLKKTKNYLPGYHFKPKNNEVIINNWGKTKEESLKENSNNNNFHTINYHSNNYHTNNYANISFDKNSFNTLSPNEKVKQMIKPVDNMNKFLTDEPNENEVNSFFLRQKQNKQNYYKELLYSQFIDSAKKYKNLYGTEDILIVNEKKKKLITENPYREKNVYEFGDSSLENNPILNPENNIRYNKYLNNFYPDIQTDRSLNENNMFNNDINNNSNNDSNSNINIEINENNFNDYINYNNRINNIYKNNYTNQKLENSMAINGNNIINNYENNHMSNYDIYKNNIRNNMSKYQYNSNGLSRNYSDLYNYYKTTKNNYNFNDNDDYRHKLLNNSRRSMSQINL